MKMTFFPSAIFLVFLSIGFGFIDVDAQKSPTRPQNLTAFQEEIAAAATKLGEVMQRCFELEGDARKYGNESDFVAEFLEQKKNATIACQNVDPNNQIAAKQLSFVNAWIELPEKLVKTEEDKTKWKVLAFVFIGITSALLLFIVSAGVYFYKLGRNKF